MPTTCDEIIILDDETSYAEMLTSMLCGEGFNAKMFTKPAEAVEYIRRHPCALVVADYKMPDLNGTEFLQQVRENNPDLPVIMISGHMNTKDLVSVANIGVTLVLEKPFDNSVLIENIHRFVAPEAEDTPAAHTAPAPTAAAVAKPIDPFPKDSLRCAHSSKDAQDFLQSLWDALKEHNGATLALPLGGELELIVADVEKWFGLESPALRLSPAMMKVDTSDFSDSKVLALLDARYASSDLSEEVALLRQKLPKQIPLIVVQRADNAKAAGGLPLTVLPPLSQRMIDIATYSRAILERVGSTDMLCPDATRLLLNYPWPGNYYELMGALRRAVLACETESIDGLMLARAISDGHGAASASVCAIDLEKYLAQAQALWFDDAGCEDLESAAKATHIDPSKFDLNEPIYQQALLFPELLEGEG